MIRRAIKSDSPQLAKLHVETLTTSFLAGLGINFLSGLYNFLILTEKVWVYEERDKVMGFVSYSENSSGIMKRFLFKSPGSVIQLMLKIIVQPANLKRILETIKAPSLSGNISDSNNIQHGELLSIAVNPQCQASGIGSQLLNVLEEYLRQSNILKYKVIAGVELLGANKFYLKNKFVLASQITIHGNKLSNVYIKEL